MREIPREHEKHRRSPGALETWARLEAKTEAMVEDVLVSAGTAEPGDVGANRTLRRLATAASALLIAAIVGGSAWFALDQRSWDAERDTGVAAGDDRSLTTAAREMSRFGPFRP
jgi:hypothetical protein